jgi:hypothetical protein
LSNAQDDLNEDWIKTLPGGWDFPPTWDEFIEYVAGGLPIANQKKAVKYYQGLPMWKAAPTDVRQGAAKFIAGG